MSRLVLILILFTSGLARAEKLKLGYAVDSSLGLKEAEVRGRENNSGIFYWRGTKPGLEVAIKGTTFESAQEAREFSQVELNNIVMLYGKRGNPYKGQISSLVTCDPLLMPKPQPLKVQGADRQLLLLGANSRKSFGACNKDQIEYWAAYFNYIDDSSHTVFSIRVFKEIKDATSAHIAAANRELFEIVPRLLVKGP